MFMKLVNNRLVERSCKQLFIFVFEQFKKFAIVNVKKKKKIEVGEVRFKDVFEMIFEHFSDAESSGIDLISIVCCLDNKYM